MKIKVKKASRDYYWYRSEVGKVFDVEFETNISHVRNGWLYFMRDKNGDECCFQGTDVELIEDCKPILPIPETTLEWLQARQKELQDYVIQCMEHGDEIDKSITTEYYRNQQRILEIENGTN